MIFLDYYADLDGDGYGSGAAFGFCSDPGGTYVLLTGDCDDDNIAVNPAATEICNGIDDDCDGLEIMMTELFSLIIMQILMVMVMERSSIWILF
ncbi:MAG: putative metal-binding motif-containing protein [Bacteroidetes bacterium]|nr:putative metal-binding motif-containing protein [Bacteroidota bacterium]